MSEENSWKEFSDDISNMSKKIKSKAKIVNANIPEKIRDL